MSRTPTIYYPDAHTLGQLVRHWEKSSAFVDRMISEGKLVVDERNLVTNEALGNFYQAHAIELD